MSRVFVGLGSNVDKEIHTVAACAALRDAYGALLESSLYESPAVGFDGADFYNMVVAFDTDDALAAVEAVLCEIETQQGRVRGKDRFVARTLDLDVLLYGTEVVRKDGAVYLPRAEITEQEFVLGPLAEIAGDLVHPIAQVPIAQLWTDYQKAHTPQMRRVSKFWAEPAPAVDS